MIKFEDTKVTGWEDAIRGMRNPVNSWGKSDSCFWAEEHPPICTEFCRDAECDGYKERLGFAIGAKDLDLMERLCKAGTEHRKFMRMIIVYVDITAPLYWWKEFDTYKVGTVVNSCSTMHKIADKEFTLEDFSHEHLMNDGDDEIVLGDWIPLYVMEHIIAVLNRQRNRYLETKDKKYWWQMIQLLPSSYNQKRTVMLNYEVLANIYKSRKRHKLDEWSWHDGVIDGDRTDKAYIGFCDWIETLPYSELITG